MNRIRFEYVSVPKDSGTFAVYRNIRPLATSFGIEMLCASVGHEQALLCQECMADDGCVLLVPDDLPIEKQARTFIEWCEESDIDNCGGQFAGDYFSAASFGGENMGALALHLWLRPRLSYHDGLAMVFYALSGIMQARPLTSNVLRAIETFSEKSVRTFP